MNTTRNHTVLLTLLAIGTFMLVSWLFVASNAAHAKFACTGGTYVVQPGDTLYGVAMARCEGNIVNAVHHIEKMNGGSLIHPGQTLTLPLHD